MAELIAKPPFVGSYDGSVGELACPVATCVDGVSCRHFNMLNNIEMWIDSSHNQFGFKSNHSTDIYMYTFIQKRCAKLPIA